MWQRLKNWFSRPDPLAGADLTLIERVVERASPRIRLATRYRERLAPYTGWAEARAVELASLLPEPTALTDEEWRHNRLLQLLFANPQRMHDVVSGDPDITGWFDDWPLADSTCALLHVHCDESTRYGLAEQDGVLRQDVAQRILRLRDHDLGEPAANAQALQQLLPLRILDVVANEARRQIATLEQQRSDLEEQLGNARTMLRLQRYGSAEYDAQQQRLQQFSQQLEQLHQQLAPDQLCQQLENALAATPDLLRIQRQHWQVSPLGMLNSEDSDALPVTLTEVTLLRDPPLRLALVPVCIERRWLTAR